jgi:manganese/iron transport system ATP-binding protein/manganese/zinc/iron transport system ATP- binding protein
MKPRETNSTAPLTQSAFSIRNLTVNYGTVPALLDISLELPKGHLIGVIGSNGSGKSTLVKAMLGFLKPDVGSISVLGQNVTHSKNRIAYVPQRREVDWDFPVTVREVAVMGRYGKRHWWQDLVAEDYRWADESLSKLKMDKYRHRQIGQLSGGQQQRVFLARALAQDAEILLLDEPFTGVDMATEEAILHVLREYKAKGKTVITVHHDLSTAASYFDLLVLLKQKLYGFGPPDRVLDPNLLCEVYEGNVRAFAQISRSRGDS